MREYNEGLKKPRCPFCRHLAPGTNEEAEKLSIERAKLNDPFALHGLGTMNYRRGDYDEALKYWTKAAALGNVDAMYSLAGLYRVGKAGVDKDRAEERALLEKAAIAGHPRARYFLGCYKEKNGRIDRAVLHWIIASNLGDDQSIKVLKECYKEGYVSKVDFAAALRAHQAAVDATKSPQREMAEVYHNSVR